MEGFWIRKTNTEVGDQFVGQLRTVKQLIDQRVFIDKILAELNVSHGSAYSFFYDDLGYRKGQMSPKAAVQSCLKTIIKSIFVKRKGRKKGICKLVYRWTKCVSKQETIMSKTKTNNFCNYWCKKSC